MISLAFLDLWDHKYVEAIKRIENINWKVLSNPILLANILEFNEWVKKAEDRCELDAWSAIVSKKMWDDATFWYYQDKLKNETLPVELKEYIIKLDL